MCSSSSETLQEIITNEYVLICIIKFLSSFFFFFNFSPFCQLSSYSGDKKRNVTKGKIQSTRLESYFGRVVGMRVSEVTSTTCDRFSRI